MHGFFVVDRRADGDSNSKSTNNLGFYFAWAKIVALIVYYFITFILSLSVHVL